MYTTKKAWIQVLVALAAFALLAGACGGDDGASGTTAAPGTTAATTTAAPETTAATTTTAAPVTTEAMDACAVDSLNLVTPGQLTVATGEPVFPPWMGVGDDYFDVPESKTGYEGALVYALAEEMGFTDDQVVFVRTGFDEAIAPGPKDWDFNIQQYSITDDRKEVVDFSDPYYTTRQALVALPDSPVIGATTLADLADAKLGAAVGTTSFDYVENVIGVQAQVYDDNVNAISALIAGQLDGIVVDLPTAYYITAVQIPDQGAEGVIVAQFEAAAAQPDQYGMLFAKGNELVPCVNQALATLKDQGMLDQLEAEWLTQGGEIVTISE
ncbi:MAG: ABC transporter substrate-binding protein [Acidimicrobiia bacterium]